MKVIPWVQRDSSGAHHPLNPVIKLGIRHPRNKEKNKDPSTHSPVGTCPVANRVALHFQYMTLRNSPYESGLLRVDTRQRRGGKVRRTVQPNARECMPSDQKLSILRRYEFGTGAKPFTQRAPPPRAIEIRQLALQTLRGEHKEKKGTKKGKTNRKKHWTSSHYQERPSKMCFL